MLFEYGIGAKWPELLKEIAPCVTRAAVLRDPDISVLSGLLGAIQAVAPSFGMEVRPVGVRDAPEIERAVTAFARGPNDIARRERTGRGCYIICSRPLRLFEILRALYFEFRTECSVLVFAWRANQGQLVTASLHSPSSIHIDPRGITRSLDLPIYLFCLLHLPYTSRSRRQPAHPACADHHSSSKLPKDQ